MKYTVRKAYEGSHHIYDSNDNLIAKVEEIIHNERKNPLLFWLPNNKKSSFVITHLPGADKNHFLTLHAAATHAVYHHFNGKHLEVPDPIDTIGDHMENLKDAIWNAASHPHMEDDDSQIKLLDLSKDHAELHKKFKSHFKGEK